MFSDPVTITINGVAKTLARVQSQGMSSLYQTADGLISFRISHTKQNNDRLRSVARLDVRKVVTNPLDSSDQDYDTTTTQYIIERPFAGFTVTEVDYQSQALFAWLNTAAVTKMFGQES